MPSTSFPQTLFLMSTLISSLHADTILLDHTFDGDDANDLGPAFQEVKNSVEGGGTSDLATGLVTTGTSNSSTCGLNNVATLDVAALDPTAVGFTVTFHVGATTANIPDVGANGLFFGVVSGTGATDNNGDALWNNDPDSFGYVASSNNHGDHVMSQNGLLSFSLSTSQPTPESFQDGFTVSISVFNNDIWTVSSTGLSTELSNSGILNPSDFSYTDIINDLGLFLSLQGQAGSTIDIDRITLTTPVLVTPESVPSMVLVDHTFDGLANDTGPGFQQVNNGRGGSTDLSTGVVTTGDTETFSTVGFNNVATLDIPTLDPDAIGFRATFDVSAGPSSVSSLGSNGFFLGIVSGTAATGTSGNSLHLNDPAAFGYTAGSGTFGDNVMVQAQETDAATGEIATPLGTPPSDLSFEDGFTISISVYNDNTWTITSTGLDTDLDNSGILFTGSGYFSYADIATDIGLFTTLQQNVAVPESATIDRITLTTLVAAPASDPRITSVKKSGNTVTIKFTGADGATYDLNKSTTLDFSSLNSVGSIKLDGTNTGELEDPNATEEAAFYRIEEQ